jgi:hypothetical protein
MKSKTNNPDISLAMKTGHFQLLPTLKALGRIFSSERTADWIFVSLRPVTTAFSLQ